MKDALADADLVREVEPEVDGERDTVGLRDCVGETEPVLETVAVADHVKEALADADRDCDDVTVLDGLADADRVIDDDDVTERVRVPDAVADHVYDARAVAERVRDGDELVERVRVTETDALLLRLRVGLTVPVTVRVPGERVDVIDGDIVVDRVRLTVTLPEEERDCVPVGVADHVMDARAVSVIVAVDDMDGDELTLTVIDAVADTVAVADGIVHTLFGSDKSSGPATA